MRVGFFGQSGPYAPVALRLLVSARRNFEIALVVEGRRQKEPGRRDTQLFESGTLAALPEGDDLKALACAAGIPTLVTCDVNGADAVQMIARHDLDWIVCVGFDRLFSRDLLAAAHMGGINAHPSRLPELRGPSPLFWAIRQGRRDSAITLHALDMKEDHGVVYAQEGFVLPRRSTGEQLYGVAGALAAQMLVSALDKAKLGGLAGMPQDHTRATRAPRPTGDDVFVEPAQWTCERLVDFCCAAPYFRTPWMRLGDETFFARRGLVAEAGRELPADYVQSGTTLVVRCQDGVAHLEIQT
jgi:methionyl-tRNA formyltransferase